MQARVGWIKPAAKGRWTRNASAVRNVHMLYIREKIDPTSPRIGHDVTAAKARSVWTPRPPVGWLCWQVSWLAGRCLASSLPSFPVAVSDAGSPLTVAGAATD